MAKPVIQYDAGKLTAIAAGTDNQVLTYDAGTGTALFESVPYDIAGSVAGTPSATSDCFFFVAVRACTIQASGHQARCRVAPSGGNATFTVNKNGASIGTFTIDDGLLLEAFSLTQTSLSAGDYVTVTAGANMYALEDVYFTFAAVVA